MFYKWINAEIEKVMEDRLIKFCVYSNISNLPLRVCLLSNCIATREMATN